MLPQWGSGLENRCFATVRAFQVIDHISYKLFPYRYGLCELCFHYQCQEEKNLRLCTDPGRWYTTGSEKELINPIRQSKFCRPSCMPLHYIPQFTHFRRIYEFEHSRVTKSALHLVKDLFVLKARSIEMDASSEASHVSSCSSPPRWS